MEKIFTDEQLSEQMSKNTMEAETLINDEDKMERFLERLEIKLKKVPLVGEKLSYIPMLVSLVDYFVPLATSIRLSATLIRGISNILFLYPIRSRAALIHA